MKVSLKHCYICDNEIDKKEFKLHQLQHMEDVKLFKISNDMSDACKTACKICGKVIPISRVRGHTKLAHGMVITEYKMKFNQHYYDLIEKVLHKCGLCEEIFLLDSDCIAQHIKTHKISHKDYNSRFISTMRKESIVKEDDTIGNNVEKKETEAIFVDNSLGPNPTKDEDSSTSCTLEGFHNLISNLSLSSSVHVTTRYPALETLLMMENMRKETMIKAALSLRT